MPRNLAGAYTLPTLPADGESIEANDVNSVFQDIATDLNNPLPIVAGGTGSTSASAARTALGLEIGTNVQAYNAKLQSFSGLTGGADLLPYFTGATAMGTTALTSFARTLLDDANASAARTTLGLVIGTNVQAYDADLAAIAALSPTKGNLLVGNGSAWVTVGVGTNGQVLEADSAEAAGVKWATTAAPGWTYGTAQATTSGTEFDFTGIPATVTDIEVMVVGCSLTGSEHILVQLGDSGGIETTGYESNSRETSTTSTAGLIVFVGSSSRAATGILRIISRGSGNAWLSTHNMLAGTIVSSGAGSKTLSDVLDRVRITRTGTNTFNAGSVNIRYR